MNDYSNQPNWREPDEETVRTNEFVGGAFGLFVGVILGATICGFFWS